MARMLQPGRGRTHQTSALPPDPASRQMPRTTRPPPPGRATDVAQPCCYPRTTKGTAMTTATTRRTCPATAWPLLWLALLCCSLPRAFAEAPLPATAAVRRSRRTGHRQSADLHAARLGHGRHARRARCRDHGRPGGRAQARRPAARHHARAARGHRRDDRRTAGLPRAARRRQPRDRRNHAAGGRGRRAQPATGPRRDPRKPRLEVDADGDRLLAAGDARARRAGLAGHAGLRRAQAPGARLRSAAGRAPGPELEPAGRRPHRPGEPCRDAAAAPRLGHRPAAGVPVGGPGAGVLPLHTAVGREALRQPARRLGGARLATSCTRSPGCCSWP